MAIEFLSAEEAVQSQQEERRRVVAALNRLKREFENGNVMALLKAAGLCGRFGLLMPRWVSGNFNARLEKVLRFEIRSLDEAFENPYGTKIHLDKAKARSQKTFRVYNAVLRHAKLEPIDNALFAKVGKDDVGVGEVLCKKLYKKAQRILQNAEEEASVVDDYPSIHLRTRKPLK